MRILLIVAQAHDTAIRAAQYSHAGDWLLSADQDGVVKYWQPNFNNVKILESHTEAVRDLAYVYRTPLYGLLLTACSASLPQMPNLRRHQTTERSRSGTLTKAWKSEPSLGTAGMLKPWPGIQPKAL